MKAIGIALFCGLAFAGPVLPAAAQEIAGTITGLAGNRIILVDAAGESHTFYVTRQTGYDPAGWRPNMDDRVSLAYFGIKRGGRIILRAARVTLIEEKPAEISKVDESPRPVVYQEETAALVISAGSGRGSVQPAGPAPPPADEAEAGRITVQGGRGRDAVEPAR